jgi:ABC-type transporter Mla MlaB component
LVSAKAGGHQPDHCDLDEVFGVGGAAHGEDPVAPDAVNLDVSWLASPDLPALVVLARLHVVACRGGRSLWLHGASSELIELLELVGLREIVHLCPSVGRSGDRFGHAPRS